jgi:hypothetical protein
MTFMKDVYELIVSAFAKFLAADISIGHARYGLFGIWVGKEGDKPCLNSEAQLDRALALQKAWSRSYKNFPNPYSDLVILYKTGVRLGRWENNILDVFDQNGDILSGVPLGSLIEAANKSLQRTSR